MGELLGEVHGGHRLKPNPPWTAQGGEEKSFAAKQDVLEATHHFHVHLNRGLVHRDVTGIHFEDLTGFEGVLDNLAIKFDEGQTGASDPLHNEALAAEEARAQFAPEVDVKLHTALGNHEGVFLADQLLTRAKVEGYDLARQFSRKADQRGTAGRGKADHEDRLAGKHALEGSAQTAFHVGFHLDIGAHPAHAATLRKDGLTLGQFERDRLQGSADNFVAQTIAALTCARNRGVWHVKTLTGAIVIDVGHTLGWGGWGGWGGLGGWGGWGGGVITGRTAFRAETDTGEQFGSTIGALHRGVLLLEHAHRGFCCVFFWRKLAAIQRPTLAVPC